MRVILFILFILASINGVVIGSDVVSAMQQTVQYLSFLIATIFFVGAAIIDAIIVNSKKKEDK